MFMAMDRAAVNFGSRALAAQLTGRTHLLGQLILPRSFEPMQSPRLHHLARRTEISVVPRPVSKGTLREDSGLLLIVILFTQDITHVRGPTGLLSGHVVLCGPILVIG